ncbi:MAG TPA: hypothetical protein VMO26_22245 [Vicinamibacterales bacterium]|nr:hypothetical protein [Vicinamibacterales bacterium]
MTHLPLSCPRCRKPLVYIPLGGFTLHYRCADHGAIILRPLVVVESEDDDAVTANVSKHSRETSDAA